MTLRTFIATIVGGQGTVTKPIPVMIGKCRSTRTGLNQIFRSHLGLLNSFETGHLYLRVDFSDGESFTKKLTGAIANPRKHPRKKASPR